MDSYKTIWDNLNDFLSLSNHKQRVEIEEDEYMYLVLHNPLIGILDGKSIHYLGLIDWNGSLEPFGLENGLSMLDGTDPCDTILNDMLEKDVEEYMQGKIYSVNIPALQKVTGESYICFLQRQLKHRYIICKKDLKLKSHK